MLYTLNKRTLELARNRPVALTIPQLAQSTGINRYWLKQYVAGRIPDPSVNRVETLYTFLSGKQLEL